MLYEDDMTLSVSIVPLRGQSYSEETHVRSAFTEAELEAIAPPIVEWQVFDLRRALPCLITRRIIAERIAAAKQLKYGDWSDRG